MHRALVLLAAALALPLAAGAAAADSILDIVQGAPGPVVAYVGEMAGDLGGSTVEGATTLADQTLGGSGLPFDGQALRASADSIAEALNHDLDACATGAVMPRVEIPWAPDHVPSVDPTPLQLALGSWMADPLGVAQAEGTCRAEQALGGTLPL